jgi:hypothetical protein
MNRLLTSLTFLSALLSGSAMPVVAQQTIVNDNDPAVVYSLGSNITTPTSNWNYFSGNDVDYNRDEHSTNVARYGPASAWQGASVSVTWYGTSITWYGKMGPSYGEAKVSLEVGSGVAPVIFNAYNPTELDQHANVTMTAPAGVHVLTISLLDATQGSDHVQTVDYFSVIGGGALPLSQGSVAGYYQWNSGALAFNKLGGPSCPYGGGNNINCYGYLASDLSGGQFYTDTTGDSITWKFTGSLAEIYGRPDAENGFFGVTIDGTSYGPVDESYGNNDDDTNNGVLIFAAQVPNGNHSLTIANLGYNNGYYAENSNMLQIDQFVAFTTGNSGGGGGTPAGTCQYQKPPQGSAGQAPLVLSTANGTAGYWDAGSILWSNNPQVIVYPKVNGNGSQDFTWTQKSPGYTVCSNNGTNLCLANQGGNLINARVGDTFQLLPGSSGTSYYVLDVTACSYVENSSTGQAITLGSSPSNWYFSGPN